MTCTKKCEDTTRDFGITGYHYCGKPAVYTHTPTVHWCAKHYKKWLKKLEKNKKPRHN